MQVVFQKKKKNLAHDDDPRQDERNLLTVYNRLNPDGKKAALAAASGLEAAFPWNAEHNRRPTAPFHLFSS
jgi:hypothetical protein